MEPCMVALVALLLGIWNVRSNVLYEYIPYCTGYVHEML